MVRIKIKMFQKLNYIQHTMKKLDSKNWMKLSTDDTMIKILGAVHPNNSLVIILK